MELKGVEVVGRIKVSKRNSKFYHFLCPFTGKTINTRNYRNHLKSLGKSVHDMLMKINELNSEDLPKCKYCESEVGFKGQGGNKFYLDYLNPKLRILCYSDECGELLRGANIFSTGLKNGTSILHHAENLTPGQRSMRSIKTNRTMKSMIDENGNSLFYLAHRKAVLKSIENRRKIITESGVSQYDIDVRKSMDSRTENGNWNNKVSLKIGDKVEWFSSRIERFYFKKMRRFLTRYYDRELFVSEYDSSRYRADYVLKSDYCETSSRKLPDVIEIKHRNLIYYRGDFVGGTNYKKFKSVLDLGLSLLIIDGKKFTFINNYHDLKNLFGEFYALCTTRSEVDQSNRLTSSSMAVLTSLSGSHCS